MEYNNPARSRETLTKQLIRASSVDNETQRNVNRAVEKNRSRPEKGREGKSWSVPPSAACCPFIYSLTLEWTFAVRHTRDTPVF